MTEQELIKKFEKMKGYGQIWFDHEEFLEMEAYIRGYRQAIEDLHIIIIENSEKYQALKKEIDEYYDEDNEDDLFDLSDIIEKHF